jgi:glyceraldehyde 3-phosphate dehydrogenase
MRIAINGLGRIGKNLMRMITEVTAEHSPFTLAAINLGPGKHADLLTYLKYDTFLGPYTHPIEIKGARLYCNGHVIELLAHAQPAECQWGKLAIDCVVECSGKFTEREKAALHIQAGARRVLISAPSKTADCTIILGVNEQVYKPAQHTIISLGSCTTNALVPVVACLDKAFGVERALFTTVHAYTNTQALLDSDMDDPRRARAAALNIVPSSSGASSTVAFVLPHLKDKVQGHALRVPVGRVSIVDLSFVSPVPVTAEGINKALYQAARSTPDIIGYTTEPLVSSDFGQDRRSVIVDSLLTQAEGNLGKVFGWYDNEWGYSARLFDFLAVYLAK